MKKIFLAFSFRDEDRELAAYIEQVMASQYIQVITGEKLGGQQLTPAVQSRIDQADGLIALLTRRDKKLPSGYTTHQWVQDEIGYARNKGKRAIALIENEVDVGGMYAPHEFIPFDQATLVKALLRLAETVGDWKREAGRTMKVQVLPKSLANKLGQESGSIKCKHRFVVEGKCTDWKEVNPVMEVGGTFVYLEGVRDECMIELRVEDQTAIWRSPAVSQWMQIQLQKGGSNK